MSTVRCPDCGRALKLPEGAGALTARCPLCGHEFNLSGPDVPPFPAHQAVLIQTLPPPDLDDADRAAIQSAAFWLLCAGGLVPLYAFFPGCYTLAGLVFAPGVHDWVGRGGAVVALVLALALQVVAVLPILVGGVEVSHRGQLGWVRAANRTTTVLAVYSFASAVIILLLPGNLMESTEPFRLGLFAAGVGTGLICRVAAQRSAIVLARPRLKARLALPPPS